MASILRRLPIAAVIFLAVALSATTTATARPCRSFLISSYSIRNPSTNNFATVTVTEIQSLTINTNNHFFKIPFNQNGVVFPLHRRNHHRDLSRASLPRASSGIYGYDFASLRDRTKDILSVVLALLFGFGCGSLVAATMYLLWFVLSGRRFDDLSDDDSHGAEIESFKKLGYVKIPAAEKTAAPPAAAKDSSSV
ncbi:hypothetical protein HN51_061140 [Arachis hypogaea]|uniref:Uncharacterized protein n=1 Tax=Arachis hypogaea TaxID=3818 RepID=A0A445AM67_ARAHY|nr:uncharacterized protein LOC107639558 [Arachis ipaensis]XP_025626318.1 uncharacterized protein LOC112719821 [Arachis hypogaea]QHO18324.1 uncharacterized protein DS421_11g319530 [Arachis hypogaea]RYR27518.1 hypothetical protein Ahy_B01g051537 [Arachis hypogaea]